MSGAFGVECQRWLQNLQSKTEKDAVVVGDFNRFLNGKNPWKEIMITDFKSHYRIPLLEAIKKD